jgi:hypothetical protein
MKILNYILIAILMVTAVAAVKPADKVNDCSGRIPYNGTGFGDNKMCQALYGNDYQLVSKWQYSGGKYNEVVSGDFGVDVSGNITSFDWSSDISPHAMLIHAGCGQNLIEALNPGISGSGSGLGKDVSFVAFCAKPAEPKDITCYKCNSGKVESKAFQDTCQDGYSDDQEAVVLSCGVCTGPNCHGVPEYTTTTLVAAVLAVTLGLVYLRKR